MNQHVSTTQAIERRFSADMRCGSTPRARPSGSRAAIREQVLQPLRRRGAVLGLSGGIDSSVTAALCVARAWARRTCLRCLMPEKDSDPDSLRLGRLVADSLGIETVVEDIAPMLTAAGCYQRRDECIRKLVPGLRRRLGLQGRARQCAAAATGYNITSLVVQSPDGRAAEAAHAARRLSRRRRRHQHEAADAQADRVLPRRPAELRRGRHANRLEYDQGFFVKNGDGAADFKPIAHLYKTQVYQLAEHLGVPEEIRRRPPTTDTWSLAADAGGVLLLAALSTRWISASTA